MGRIAEIHVSSQTGSDCEAVAEIVVNDRGFAGDAHEGARRCQVSLRAIDPSCTASPFGADYENLLTEGIDLSRVGLLDKIRVGEVILEAAEILHPASGGPAGAFGVYCRVLHGGLIRLNDEAEHIPRLLRVKIITLSDRAFSGQYEDRGGPKIRERLETFFHSRPWRVSIQTMILPDEQEMLIQELENAQLDGVDAVFTTGGTGVGPRDVTPEAVLALADKTIPGLMEYIRVKYGEKHPAALLSRSIAAVAGKTLIFTLPGSVGAVEDYMAELIKTFEHLIYMINDIDAHPAPVSSLS